MRTTRKYKTKTKIAVLATALIAITGTAAYAYWTTSGTGTGTATTGTSAAVNAVQTSVVTDMGPGDSPQTLSGTLQNTDTQPLYVTSVTASISSVTKDPGAVAGTCDATDYTLAGAVMAVGAEAVVADTSPWGGATIKFNNKGTNQDQCKLATVNIAYVVS